MTKDELEHFKNCEAREWVSRVRAKTKELGKRGAEAWWANVVNDIKRIRGEGDAYDLRKRMHEQKTAPG